MTTTLIPDLGAAGERAHQHALREEYAAAWHLLPQTFIAPDGRRYETGPNLKLATAAAERARADRYEERHLFAAAVAELGGAR